VKAPGKQAPECLNYAPDLHRLFSEKTVMATQEQKTLILKQAETAEEREAKSQAVVAAQ